MCNCHSILECCVMFPGVKLSIRSFNLLLYLTCGIADTRYTEDCTTSVNERKQDMLAHKYYELEGKRHPDIQGPWTVHSKRTFCTPTY